MTTTPDSTIVTWIGDDDIYERRFATRAEADTHAAKLRRQDRAVTVTVRKGSDPFGTGTGYRTHRSPSGWSVIQQSPNDPSQRRTVFKPTPSEHAQAECDAWVEARQS